MSMIEKEYIVEVENLPGYIKVVLSKAKAPTILSELERHLPISSTIFYREGMVYLHLGIRKGARGKTTISKEGMVVYDVLQDSLGICLESKELPGSRYVEVGYVSEGLDLVKSIKRRYKALIRRA